MNVLRSFVGIPILALVVVQSLSGAESLSLVRTIDLPRVEGRIDHMAIDMAASCSTGLCESTATLSRE